MRLSKMFKPLLVAASLSFAALSASAITVNFSGDVPAVPGGGSNNSGFFSGTDSNMDGMLSFGELTGFSASFPARAINVGLSDLVGFGSYGIDSNTWLANGGPSGQSFFAWVDDSGAVMADTNLTAGFVYATTPVAVNGVPEPGSLALLGLGIAGLAEVKRRKAK